MKTIAIIGSCDTKWREIRYMRSQIEENGLNVIVIDVSTGEEPSREYDISRDQVIRNAGSRWPELREKTKGEKIAFMMKAVSLETVRLYEAGEIHGVLAAGGLQNTVMATAAMKALPLGVPKVMVTTVACGQKRFDTVVGKKDIVVLPSICDFTGLNCVTRQILQNACACCVGMVKYSGKRIKRGEKTVVGVTLMGITNTGACAAINELERMGLEPLGFHATGTGGVLMEEMAAEGLIDGILDLTTHEITQEYFKGGFSYSEEAKFRLVKSVRQKVPLVICPGGLDFVDFATKEFPKRMDERAWMYHNSDVAHIKLLPDEAEQIAEYFVQRLRQIDYPVKLLLPTEGMRHNTREGEELYCKEVDEIILDKLKSAANPYVQVITIEGNLDTKEWGIQAARCMVEELKESGIDIRKS